MCLEHISIVDRKEITADVIENDGYWFRCPACHLEEAWKLRQKPSGNESDDEDEGKEDVGRQDPPYVVSCIRIRSPHTLTISQGFYNASGQPAYGHAIIKGQHVGSTSAHALHDPIVVLHIVLHSLAEAQSPVDSVVSTLVEAVGAERVLYKKIPFDIEEPAGIAKYKAELKILSSCLDR